MDEYIKREQVLKLLESAQAWNWSMNTLYDEIQALPAEDVAPVVHGRWIEVNPAYGIYECSVCGSADENCSDYYGEHNVKRQGYCPNCGARLDL